MAQTSEVSPQVSVNEIRQFCAKYPSAKQPEQTSEVLSVTSAPTEIDAICGAVVRVGKQVGVPTPVNRVMWQLVRAVGLEEQSQGWQNSYNKKNERDARTRSFLYDSTI